jgi:hypothetical protein
MIEAICIVLIIVLQVITLRSVQKNSPSTFDFSRSHPLALIINNYVEICGEQYKMKTFAYINKNNLYVYIWDDVLHVSMLNGFSLIWNLKTPQKEFKGQIENVCNLILQQRNEHKLG